MKKYALTWIAGGIAIGLLMSGGIRAQAPSGQVGRPDLSGVWRATNDRHLGNLSAGRGQLPFQPWAATLYKQRQASKGKGNPAERCLPRGVPGTMLVRDRPWRIVQTPGTIIMLFDELLHYRQIFTDGRGFPADFVPTWFGYSVGKWDRDALVVETIGFNEETWLDDGGLPHSGAMRVTERFQRRNAKTLDISFTIEDPKAYMKPWTATVQFEQVSEADFGEHICAVKPAS